MAEPVRLKSRKGDFLTEVKDVTPVQAQEWMDKRANNRRIDPGKVLAMARDMTAGRWRLTHQGIAFDEDGSLVDGQHRLAAIILADRPVTTQVSWNLPHESHLVIDDHRPRSGADVLSIETGSSVDTLIVAMLRMIEAPGLTNGNRRYSKSELRDAFETHGRAVRFVVDNLKAHTRGITVAPILTPAARAFYGHDRDRLKEFLTVLASGIPQHTPDDTAALRLRDWCMGMRDARRKPTRVEQYNRAQNALRHFLNKKDPGQIRAAEGDLFPLPEGLARSGLTDAGRRAVEAMNRP